MTEPLALTNTQVAQFHRDGYVIIESLFNNEEMDLLRKIGKADQQLKQEVRTRRDLEGGITQLSLREELQEDIYSAIVRNRRLVRSVERLLDSQVYHFHHKMIFKDPFVGGAWEWHQDYGYWYNYGILFPYLVSCMIAVDRATRENGCLQVVKGSHRMGRIEHSKAADQTGANLERVSFVLQRMELVYCELESGSTLFFHCNLLHRSDQNRSPNPRWAFICCYNSVHNEPCNEPYREHYRNNKYLETWPDAKIQEIGRRQMEGLQASLQTGGR